MQEPGQLGVRSGFRDRTAQLLPGKVDSPDFHLLVGPGHFREGMQAAPSGLETLKRGGVEYGVQVMR